ncbi:MAG: hypothetical protein ABII75_01340 [Candidatus Omnitrophota bacterium]
MLKKEMAKSAIIITILFIILELTGWIIGGRPLVGGGDDFSFAYIDIYKKIYGRKVKDDTVFFVRQKDGFNCSEFTAVKKPNAVRFFILGGSVAQTWDGVLFEEWFNSLVPDKKAEIINCGMGGYDAYRVSLVAEEILSYEPDFIIVLSGNNEFYDPAAINKHAYQINKILRRSAFIAWLQDVFMKNRRILPRSREARLADYEKHIRQMAALAKSKNIPLVLCTLPFRFKDMPPKGARAQNMNLDYIAGFHFLHCGQYREAIAGLENFLREYPGDVLGHYFLGRAHEGIKNYSEAKKHYLQAVESHQASNSASISSNNIIRKVCVDEKIPLVDLEKLFMQQAPHGLTGDEQFWDNCHIWDDYYALVSEAVFKGLWQYYRGQEFVFKKIDSAQLAQQMNYPPPLALTERSGERKYIERLWATIIWETIKTPSEIALNEHVVSCCETLYRMCPPALWQMRLKEPLFQELVKIYCLRDAGMPFGEEDLKPIWPRVFSHIAEAYRRLGQYQESLVYFNNAIEMDKNSYLPYLGRALVYCAVGDKGEACKSIDIAEIVSPNPQVKYYRKLLGLETQDFVDRFKKHR